MDKKSGNSIFFKLTIIAVILIVFVVIALSPVFNVRQINVSTRSLHYDAQKIISASGAAKGENAFRLLWENPLDIFRFRFTSFENNIIKECHFIKSAAALYRLPDKIDISLVERIPLFYIFYLGNYLLVDEDAFVLDVRNDRGGIKVPVLKGPDLNDYRLGSELKTDNRQVFDIAVEIIKTVILNDSDDNFKIYDMIEMVDVTEKKSIYLFMKNDVTVKLGEATKLEYKIAFLRQILLRNEKKDDKGLIDFTTGEDPVFIIEKPE